MRTGLSLAGLPQKLLALGAAPQGLLLAQSIGFLNKPLFERLGLPGPMALLH